MGLGLYWNLKKIKTRKGANSAFLLYNTHYLLICLINDFFHSAFTIR